MAKTVTLLKESALPQIITDLENAVEADRILAQQAKTAAEAAMDKSQQWAEKAENSPVETGKYSALHWAAKAEDEKLAAEVFKNKADKFANESENVEVESGKYSAKHYSLKAAASAAGIADSAEMLIKHEAEIASLENTINSANINQETTATVTGVDTVALPKTAANTGMSVQLFGQSAQNLVVNGDFRNGTTGWTTNGSLVGGEINLNTASVIQLKSSYPSLNTNKYYLRLKGYGDVANVTIGCKHFSTITVSNILSFPLTTTPAIYSGIITNTADGDKLDFARVSTSGIAKLDDILAINLTATFGAGNEPTKEQCDVLFANYFEGSDNVLGTGRVRSVGKNLFDSQITPYAIIPGTTYFKIPTGYKIKNLVSATFKYVDIFTKLVPNTQYTISLTATLIQGQITWGAIDPLTGAFYNGSRTTTGNIVFTTNSQGTVSVRLSSTYSTNSIGEVDYTNIQIERGSTATSYEPYRPSSLYLTTPELRSNGTTKDEIRKGTNGYELVKRVGVGTLGANGITGGDFEGGLIGTIGLADEIATWTLNTTNPISGIRDGRLVVTTVGTSSTRPLLSFPISRTIGQLRKLSFSYKVNSGNAMLSGYSNGGAYTALNNTLSGSGVYSLYYVCGGTATTLPLYFNGTNLFEIQIDNLKDELVNTADGATTSASITELGSNIHYTLAKPTITPIPHTGLLNSNSNGTAYFEPIIADAGVYSSNLAVQLTDYPIASFESIRKYANGAYIELNIATAVIASGGLSFTHPDLTAGDLVMFTYAYANESIGRSMALTYAISNSNPYYNITNSVPLTTGYYTSTTARAAVPEGIRKTGLILTYETAAGVWYTERYIGTATDTTSWTTAGNWEIGVLRIAAVTDTTEYAEITI